MCRILCAFVVLAVLSACGSVPAASQAGTPAPEVPSPSLLAQATSTPPPTDTPAPTQTPAPTDTPGPTATPTPRPASSYKPDEAFALNNLGSQERGGLRLEIARVVVARKDVLEAEGLQVLKRAPFQDVDVVAEVVFRVTNTTSQKITVYPDHGTVVVGSEQITLADWVAAAGVTGERISGELFPGVTAQGGIWFGIKRSELPEVTQMIIAVTAPLGEGARKLGEDFEFQLDLSRHIYEPVPEDVQ